MPYIEAKNRDRLDAHVDNVASTLQERPFAESLGDINYLFSRIVAKAMGGVSYSKIAMATGVLENIKQELYRRVASQYEDRKIEDNGDIEEYSRGA